MPEITFTNEELNELLVVLNVALHDTTEMIRLSHDTEEIDAYKEHRQNIRKWIRRFSALVQAEGKS